MDPSVIGTLKALSDPTRLRIVGRLAAAPASVDELSRELSLPLPVVVRQVGLLRRVGLVATTGPGPTGQASLRLETLAATARELDAAAGASADGEVADATPGLAPDDARILRGFLDGRRLATIPAQPKKRLVVLRWLLEQVFTEDRGYPEKEVNQRLALFHADVAALRRYLVDEGLATRSGGVYRRAASSAGEAVLPPADAGSR